MKEKVKALSKFKEFKENVEKQVGKKIQCLCTDKSIHHMSFQNTYMSVEYVDNSQHLVETCRNKFHVKNIPPRF